MTIALLIIGLLLIVLNVRSIKKEEKSFEKALTVSKDNLGDFAIQVGELRKEFAESILELQSEIEELKEKISNKDSEHSNIENLENSQENLKESPKENPKEDDEPKYEAQNSESHLTTNQKVIPPSSIGGGNYLNKYTSAGVKSPSEVVNNSIADDALAKDNVEVLSKTDIEQYVTEIKKEPFSDNGIRTQQIQTMLSEGYSVDEISEKLNIGKGEILLIKDLYIK